MMEYILITALLILSIGLGIRAKTLRAIALGSQEQARKKSEALLRAIEENDRLLTEIDELKAELASVKVEIKAEVVKPKRTTKKKTEK